MQKNAKAVPYIGKDMIWIQFHCMSREHNITDKKQHKTLKFTAEEIILLIQKVSFFLHFYIDIEKPPESLGCKKIWHSMIDVK